MESPQRSLHYLLYMQRRHFAADCVPQGAVHDDGAGVVASTLPADSCATDVLLRLCGNSGTNPDAHLGHSFSLGTLRSLQIGHIYSPIEAEIGFIEAS